MRSFLAPPAPADVVPAVVVDELADLSELHPPVARIATHVARKKNDLKERLRMVLDSVRGGEILQVGKVPPRFVACPLPKA